MIHSLCHDLEIARDTHVQAHTSYSTLKITSTPAHTRDNMQVEFLKPNMTHTYTHDGRLSYGVSQVGVHFLSIASGVGGPQSLAPLGYHQ